MEMKENAKHKTWKMTSNSEPSLTNDTEVSSLKKFTIPKIRKTTEKVYLSPCCTNTREYSFIHGTLKQCRLDVSCDLQLTWQFGDSKLIHNKDLERHFTAKRSEMRESGRHGRELEENFCFLAVPWSDVVEIYRNGLSTKASTLKILGNPLLGIYMFRHVDVALNYAHSQSITVETIMIFKVLFGKVKKVQPSMAKNKVSLDPSPNFDCHMSRNTPSLKDAIELQAYNSVVYFYEYDVLSRPVGKPRQCLPYAVVTVKFIGQKTSSGQLMTSLRFPSTGFPKRLERACSLNNCTVAKRIGKGKDATVIFEHFRKPVDSFVQENCSCKALNSEISPSKSDTSNSNVQNENNSVLETYNRRTDKSLEIRDTSQEHAHDSSLSFMSSNNRESGTGDLLFSVAYLKNILSSVSAAFPSHRNTGSSSVITSKLIKDPRLMKREQRIGKQNNIKDLSDILPFDKSLHHGNPEINLSCVSTNSVFSSKVVPDDHVTNTRLDAPFNFSFDNSQFQTHNIGSKSCDYIAANEMPMTEQCKKQPSFSFPISLSNAVSEVENQNSQKVQNRSNIPVLTKQSSHPQNFYESVNACRKQSKSHISQESQSSTVFPLQNKGNIDEYIQNIGKMRPFIAPEDNSKHEASQNWWKETNNCTNETKIIPTDHCITLHQEYKEGGNLHSLGENCEKILNTQELKMSESLSSTTKNKDELDHATLELECNPTPNIECFSQKHQQHYLIDEESSQIHSLAQSLAELKLVQKSHNFNVMTNKSQEAKDIPSAKEQLIDSVISSSTIDISLDSSNCNITGDYVCVQRKNENDPMSLKNIQKGCNETSHIKQVQAHSLFYNAELNCDLHLNSKFKEQKDKENPNEAKEEYSALYPEYKIENLNGSEKEDIAAETALLESEHSVTAIRQRHAQNDEGSVKHLASIIPEIAGSSMSVAENAAKPVVSTTVLTPSANHEDRQKYQFKETCSSESSDLDLIKYVSDCEHSMDKNKLEESFDPLVNENSVLQTFELGREIEIEFDECNDANLFPQDTYTYGNAVHEELELYETLKSRIDWKGLFLSSSEEMETSGSFAKRENSDHPHSTESNCVSFSSQSNRKEFHNPVLLPDLQVTITNVLKLGFSPTADSLEMKDNFYEHTTKSTEREGRKEGKDPGFGIYSQPSDENSGFLCGDKSGNSIQELGLGGKSGISHSSNLGNKTLVNNTYEKPNSESFSTKPNDTVINGESKFSSTKSKPGFNDTRNKDMESRRSERKLHKSRGQNIPHKDLRQHETYQKRRKLTSRDSSEHFSFLSQGRIKTFSQSERHIKSVLGILSSEASLCKSKCLSRKLDRAVHHLKKAHRRVHTSLQLISKVGKKRKGPLPKAYAIKCNNFWESCDLQGDGFMSERRYSKHFLSKRKYDKQGEKRFLGFDFSDSVAQGSKYKSSRTNRGRVTECLSSEILPSSVSGSLATFHVREFCDEEHHPESLAYASQNTHQLEYNSSTVKSARSSALEHFVKTSESVPYPDEALTEKENQTHMKLSNGDFAEPEHSAVHDSKDITKANNSEANVVTYKNSSVSSNYLKENNKNDTTCKADTDILVSILDSNMKHFLNVDIYEQDNLPVSVCKRKLGSIFPIGKCTVPIENSTPSIFMGNIFIDPLNLIASKRYNILQLSSVLVTAGEEDSLHASLGRHGIFAIDSLAPSPTTSYYSQIRGRKDFLKTKQCSLGNCLPIDENEVSVTEPSDLDLISVIEESKNCEKNRVKKLTSNDSSVLLEDNIKCSSKQSMSKSIEEEKVGKIERAVHKNIIEESAIDIEYRSQKKTLPKEDSFHLKKKIIKSTLMRSNDSPSDCIYTPADIGIKHKPILHAHPETSKVIALQKKPVSYMKEIKEKHCLANYTSHVAELSQILQRADEAASLQILEEEMKICQHILPLFVEAFERKQECSLEKILISRDLLVHQNLWNNCRLNLKPCAVDTLVELQMVMETIEFIKNKKRLLEGEPTFRSLLWYDETLYSELLHRPRGFQLQSNFYPAFQGRLKYNAFCELKNYHNQLVKYLAKAKKDSYYAFLKHKRQINECEAIMKNYSDCFDFCLSVPFTCGVNFGDSLGDLETLRKTILNLISKYGDSPKVHSYPGKKDHLWIIVEVITSKVNFIKNNEEVSIKICLYGLEHICFDAAKILAWKEKSHSFSKKYSQNKTEKLMLNVCAFSKLQKIYDILSENLNNEPPSSIGLEGDAVMACRFKETLVSYPDICCISEILDQAKFADLKKLQNLTQKCTDHLEILKKYFEMLQEDNINNIFITEENVLDILNNKDHGAVILKPEAIEVYIEMVMLSETVHFLKNLKAKKLDNQRFRGMLWFDLSLLPELVHCQEVMASFSFKDNSADCFWKVIESTISKLKKEMDVICGYNEAVNCSYALHLFSRELEELLEIKRLLKESKYSISTYIDFVPHVASINYGNTVTELEHNYNQFSTLLKNIMSVPQKDLGKMAHIIKVMRTIEQMKIISAKGTKSSIHFILFQILCNRRNIFQLNRKDKMNIHVTKPEESSCQPGMAMQTPSISERIIKNISKSSKKRPITVHKCEDPQEKEDIAVVPSGKKQKITMEAVTKTNRQTPLKHSRTTGSHSKDENKVRSSSSDNLKKNSVSLEMVKKISIPGSLSSLKNLQDTCTSKSESKIDSASSSSDILGSLIDKQENLNSIKKRNANFSVAETAGKDCPFETCDQKDINSIYSEDHNTLTQKLHKNPLGQTQELWPSNIKAGTDVSLVPNASMFSMPTSHSVRGVHTNLKVSDTDFERENNDILDLSIKDYVCTDSSEPVINQDKIPVLQVSQLVKTELPGKYVKDISNPNHTPFSSPRSSAPVATHSVQYSLSEQDKDPKLLTQNAGIYWNELPQSACTPIYNSSAHSFGTSYPHHARYVYHYSSSNVSAITHTYQGMTMYEAQPPPPRMFTSVASSVQSSHSTVLYSEHFNYFAEQPAANVCIPGNWYFPSHVPNSYNFQQPIFSPFVSHQPLPQAAYPYPPNPGVLPQVPWTYAPWQQEPFPPRHWK